MPTLWPKHPTLGTSISATTCVKAPGFAIRFGCCKDKCKTNKKQQGSFSMLTSRLLTGIWYFCWKILSSKLFWDHKTCESHKTYSMFILAYQNMQKHAIKQCKIVQFYAKREKDTSKWVPNTTWWEVFCVSHRKQRRRPTLWESYNVVTFKRTNTNLNRHI
jgi:hypothetical protein